MDGREALRDGMLAALWDDGPRLVYADWLEENDRHEGAKLLRNKTMFDLCRWQHDLNGWRWPCDFPIEKPTNWDSVPEYDTKAPQDKSRLMAPQFDALMNLVPWGLQLLYLNQVIGSTLTGSMTDEEFADFRNRGDDKEAARRNDARRDRLIAEWQARAL